MINLEEIKNEVQYLMEEAGCHDWDHVLRVYKMCEHIGPKEGAAMEVLLLAAALHDVGRVEELKSEKEVCHAEIGAEMAEAILKGYDLEKEKIEKIKHCILTHRSRGENIPQSKEAKVLYDSDKLDSIGAIGLGRAFNFCGAQYGGKVCNTPGIDIEETERFSKEDTAYREFYFKLSKIKDKLFTEEGRRIAKGRHDFMVDFFERLEKEVEGEI